MAMSFPQPTIGPNKRPKGQGCNSCVHSKYCLTFYWYLRHTDVTPDDYVGVACNSWSNNEVDRITTTNADDVAYTERLSSEGLLIDPKANNSDI